MKASPQADRVKKVRSLCVFGYFLYLSIYHYIIDLCLLECTNECHLVIYDVFNTFS